MEGEIAILVSVRPASVDDQGFQVVTSEVSRKTEKVKLAKQSPYSTKSKVGNPIPFK